MKIGYARVSTEDQNLDRQLEALKKEGCERIFQEKVSGRKKHRPELDRMLEMLREGDEVIVLSLDRIGRSLINLVTLVNDLHEKGVGFRSIRDGYATNDTAMGKLILHIFGGLAEFEANIISERTKEGLREARKKGRVGGRKEGLSEKAKDKARVLLSLYDQGWSVRQIMAHVRIGSTNTYYKWKKWAEKERAESQKNVEDLQKVELIK